MCLIFGRRSIVGPRRVRGPLISDHSYVCCVCARSAFIREIPENLKTCFPPLLTSPSYLSLVVVVSAAFFFGRRPCKERRERCCGNAESGQWWRVDAACHYYCGQVEWATNEQHTRRRREIFNNFFLNISSHTPHSGVFSASQVAKTKQNWAENITYQMTYTYLGQ